MSAILEKSDVASHGVTPELADQRFASAFSVGDRILGLDGLRAVAVCIVLFAHFGFYKWVPGGFGVTLFFFISGVLITRLLMDENNKFGRVHVWNFYLRRFLRLYPALLVSVVASYLLYPLFGGRVEWADVLAVVFYYANYYNMAVGFFHGNMPEHGSFQTFGVLWSLAVEEQYYLIFPVLMLWLGRNTRRAAFFFLGVLAVCLVWRFVLYNAGYGDRNYSATDTRIDSILYGALLAVLLSRDKEGVLAKRLAHPASFAAGILLIIFSFLYRDDWFRDTARYSLQGLGLMPIVTALCFSNGYRFAFGLLNSKIMVWLGAMSYSLYIFHGHAIVIGENMFAVTYTDPFYKLPLGYFFVVILLTFLFAAISYYGVERRFFALRAKFGSNVK